MAAAWDDSAVGSDISARRAAIVSCWLCGISQHWNQMVSDGGDACEDIRWYCGDAQACTQRWISRAPRAAV